MMLESSLRLLPCRLCHGNFGDTGSKELPQRCHFILDFSFSLDNYAYQQLAELLCWVDERGDRVEVGQAAQALLGSDNASSAVERGDRVFVPVIFPEFSWFQDFNTTIRNIFPLRSRLAST